MNTVGKDTRAAEKLFTEVWGDKLLNRVYLLSEGKSATDLQKEGDRLLEMAGKDEERGFLSDVFAPSLIFPGKERSQKNLTAWKNFWTSQRINRCQGSCGERQANPDSNRMRFKDL